MLKRIYNFIQKDIANALRDNIIIYILIFPIALAVGFRFFIPSLQGAGVSFAVDSSVEKGFVEKLKSYGSVEVFETYDMVAARVDKPDDVPGIIKDGENYIVLAEGNETGEVAVIAGSVIDSITQSKPQAEFQRINLNNNASPVKGISASMLALSAILIAGILIGFNIVDEKESRVIRGLAVSPMTMFEYMAARAIVALVISLVLSLLSSLILVGFGADYMKIILGIVFSLVFGVIIGLLTGGLADNQISAIAIIKVLMLFIVWIPVGSLFLPQNYQWLCYPFPHYWVFQIFMNVYTGAGQALEYWGSCIAALATSTVFMLALLPTLKKRLKLR